MLGPERVPFRGESYGVARGVETSHCHVSELSSLPHPLPSALTNMLELRSPVYV